MSTYKSYYVEGLGRRENYLRFISYMLNNSDHFSLVYFSEGKKKTESAKQMQDSLSPFRISRKQVWKWPGTTTWDTRNKYHIEVFKVDPGAVDAIYRIFEAVEEITKWMYPALPMDLAFYKNGYAWFESCTHEDLFRIFLNRESRVSFLSEFYDTSISLEDIPRELTEKQLFPLEDLGKFQPPKMDDLFTMLKKR